MERDYENWVMEMHKTYDEEDALGEDDAVIIFDSLDNKALCISPDCKGMQLQTTIHAFIKIQIIIVWDKYPMNNSRMLL